MNILSEYYKNLDKQIQEDINAIINGETMGVLTGFSWLDNLIGGMKKNHLWIVGGYSGSGKSFFILNVIDNILKLNPKTKMVMYSTEISGLDYTMRHIFLRMGHYRHFVERNVESTKDQLHETHYNYIQERLLNPDSYIIRGNIKSYEDIEKSINKLKPDLVFVDFIQELSIEGKYKEEDTMPILSAKFSKLAREKECTVIVISQVNNYAINTDHKNTRISPFSFGKQLNQSADVSLILSRRKINSKMVPILMVDVVKSRHGDYGHVPLRINNGFKLEQISIEMALQITEKYENNEY